MPSTTRGAPALLHRCPLPSSGRQLIDFPWVQITPGKGWSNEMRPLGVAIETNSSSLAPILQLDPKAGLSQAGRAWAWLAVAGGSLWLESDTIK